MIKAETLTSANAAVEAVELSLSQLDNLTEDAALIQSEISGLDQAEAELLAGSDKEASKLKQLLSHRASRDIKSASLAKVKADIANVEAATIQAGIDTSNPFGTLRDELIDLRQAEALRILSAVLPDQISNEAYRLSRVARSVIAVQQVGDLTWVRSRIELCVSNARKTRSKLEAYKLLAEEHSEVAV
jgi:hypothetical protein